MPRAPAVTLVILILTTLICSADAPADGLGPIEIVADVPTGLPSVKAVGPVTARPKHHFVGYYGITPWSADGNRLFCLESTVGDRLVSAGDRAAVCLVDPQTRELTRLAETSAWNLQQGAMLHWLPGAADRELVYNDRIDGRLVSVVFDVQTMQRRRVLDRPIAAIAPDGTTAIGLNYDRLRQIRPVTGYAGGPAGRVVSNRPDYDGLFLIDMKTGRSRLLLSVAAACRVLPPPDALADQPVWLEHPTFSRDGGRLFVIARAFDPQSKRITSVPLVMRADGSEPRALLPWAVQGASHFDWLDSRRLALTREIAPDTWAHLLFDAAAPEEPPNKLAPNVLTRDGHCTFSPDGRWMVTDTYPDERRRQHLFVMDVKSGRAARVASFYVPPLYRGDWRCDLHPRWSRDSRQLCIDSTHDGSRQVYVLELDMPKG